jgi:hypothetical protein
VIGSRDHTEPYHDTVGVRNRRIVPWVSGKKMEHCQRKEVFGMLPRRLHDGDEVTFKRSNTELGMIPITNGTANHPGRRQPDFALESLTLKLSQDKPSKGPWSVPS